MRQELQRQLTQVSASILTPEGVNHPILFPSTPDISQATGARKGVCCGLGAFNCEKLGSVVKETVPSHQQ